MKLARALNAASNARDTLVMRRSLGGDEAQGAELPTVVNNSRRRARCVPDRPVERRGTHGHTRTARYTGSPADGQADPLRIPTF